MSLCVNIKKYFSFVAIVLFCTTCNSKNEVIKIAFGSCAHQDKPQPILQLAANENPDAFVFLGDNIYGDTDNMDTLQYKYNKWASKEEFKSLKAKTKIFAIWDDHDYGRNDAGKYYLYKEESKKIFCNFFEIPKQSERFKRAGNYDVQYIKKNERIIQLLLLDVRSFRSNLLPFNKKNKHKRLEYFYELDYEPHISTDSTLLGQEQWMWLEQQLKQPADLRLICSGSQFAIEYNGYEAWANFPHEQQKLLSLIKSTQANGVLFLTGDVHYAEISKLKQNSLYPIYDITSSGITSTWDFATQNENRIEGPIMDNHFGILEINFDEQNIKVKIIDKNKNERIDYDIKLSELKF